MNWIKKHYYLLAIFLYLPSLFTFFSGDDWAHMRASQILNFSEFLNFFSFTHNAQSLTFYRPLPQQVFFFLSSSVFGINAFPYHLFVLICFGISLYLLFKLAQKLHFSDTQASLSVFLYAIAVANFPRIYFLSAFQDVLLPLFVVASLILFLDQKYFWSIIFFIFSLMSKETAVVMPFLLLGLIFLTRKNKIKSTIPYFAIMLIYLFLRFKYFGGAEGDSYVYDFSIQKILNTLFWYLAWTFGAPETLVDYVGSGLKIVPKFFTDFPVWSTVILLELGSLVSLFLISLFTLKKQIFKNNRLILFCLFLFLISLAPVIFMPWHKFTHALSLPMIGSSLALGFLFADRKIFIRLFLLVYILTNISMHLFIYPRHYSVNRALISEKVNQYFSVNYPTPPVDSYFIFTNNKASRNEGKNQSKEVSFALSQSDFFKVYYHDRNFQVYYADLGWNSTPSGTPILLDSSQFLIR